jgi:TonB family protein
MRYATIITSSFFIASALFVSAQPAFGDSVKSPSPSDHPTPMAATDADFFFQAPLIYPQWAQERSIQGTVVVIVTIGVKGNLVDAVVSKTSHTRVLDEAALSAARESTYTPYVLNGVPREAQFCIVYEFKMDR